MNTLDDLRGTLERHADTLHDTERYVRPVAVHARIRAVRRRRVATVAVAAALVLLGGIAVNGSLRNPREPRPAGPTLAGVEVPGEVEVLGFPYRLVDTIPVEPGGRLAVDGKGTEQAVALVASGLGAGAATLVVGDQPVTRVRGDEEIAVAVPVGTDRSELRVRLDGTPDDASAGVAVYRATGELAPGVTDGVAVYRDPIAARQRLDAAFSSGTPAAATIHFNDRLDRVGIAEYCRTDEPGLWVNVTVDGDRFLYGECGTDPSPDAGTNQSSWDIPIAGWHTAEVFVTRGEDGPRATDADAVVGLGGYAMARTDDADADLATMEHDGRTWLLERTVDARELELETSDGDRLLAFTARRGTVWTTWRGSWDRGRSTTIDTTAALGGGTTTAGVLLAGDRYDVRLHTRGDDASGRILVYRPE